MNIPNTLAELKTLKTREMTALLREHGISVARDDRKPQLQDKVRQLMEANIALPPEPSPTYILKDIPYQSDIALTPTQGIPYQSGQDYPVDDHNYTKTCPACGEAKTLDEFGKREMPAGPRPQTWCRPCRSDRNRMSRNRRKRAKHAERAKKDGLLPRCKLKNPPAYIANEADYLLMNRTRKDGYEIDLQKSRHYACDTKVDEHNGKRGRVPTLEQAIDIATRIVDSTWWKNRFGSVELDLQKSKSKKGVSDCLTTEHDGAGCKARIRLAFNKAGHATLHTLLHELAHIPQRRSKLPHASHGPLYCTILLTLTERYGIEGSADALRQAYDEAGIKYGPQA